jgi:hypothetical protein
MLSDYLTNLIQEKYTLTRNEMVVVNSIFDGVLERPAILFITNTKHAAGTYRGWSINATNFFDYLNREYTYGYIGGMGDCEIVEQLKASGCRKGVITEALKLLKKKMENNI